MKNIGLRNGLMGGAAVALYFLLLYTVRKELMLNPWLQWGSMLIYVVFMFQAARQDVAENGAGREFRMKVRTPFLTFLIINLIYWLLYYSLHLYDPSLLQMETAAQMEYLRKQLASGAGDPEVANKLREQIQYLESAGMSMPLGPVILQMCVGALGGFALAAAITVLQRSNNN